MSGWPGDARPYAVWSTKRSRRHLRSRLPLFMVTLRGVERSALSRRRWSRFPSAPIGGVPRADGRRKETCAVERAAARRFLSTLAFNALSLDPAFARPHNRSLTHP